MLSYGIWHPKARFNKYFELRPSHWRFLNHERILAEKIFFAVGMGFGQLAFGFGLSPQGVAPKERILTSVVARFPNSHGSSTSNDIYLMYPIRLTLWCMKSSSFTIDNKIRRTYLSWLGPFSCFRNEFTRSAKRPKCSSLPAEPSACFSAKRHGSKYADSAAALRSKSGTATTSSSSSFA